MSQQPLQLYHSKEGMKALIYCLDKGSAKTRKQFVKAIKGKVYEIAMDKDAFLLIVRALDVIDDTALLKTGIISEILESDKTESFAKAKQKKERAEAEALNGEEEEEDHDQEDEDSQPRKKQKKEDDTKEPKFSFQLPEKATNLETFLQNQYASRVILHILAPKCKTYFHTLELAALDPPFKLVHEDGKMVTQITSKKDASKRRQELLQIVMVPLLELVADSEKADYYTRLLYGSQVFFELLKTAQEVAVDQEYPATVRSQVAALFSSCLENIRSVVEKEPEFSNILQDNVGHRLLKRLINELKPNTEICQLLTQAVQDRIVDFANINRSAFVLNSLLEQKGHPETSNKIATLLKNFSRPESKGSTVLLESLKKHIQAAENSKPPASPATGRKKRPAAASPATGSKKVKKGSKKNSKKV